MSKLLIGDFFDPIKCQRHPSSFGMFDMAIEHFEGYGFQLIEVPWKVSKKALKITCPIDQKVNAGFVASGEQSFLELILQGVLPEGRYQCLTPCYRPNDEIDKWHFVQFYKLELMDYFGDNTLLLDTVDIFDTMRYASNFIKNFTKIEPLFVEVDDEPRACETIMSADIMLNGIEYGSYGLRRHKDVGCWLYATGLALPRFQQILEMK